MTRAAIVRRLKSARAALSASIDLDTAEISRLKRQARRLRQKAQRAS